jgi:preprotein translocase subunit SecA
VADFHEEWDLTGLHGDVLTYWPSSLTVDELGAVRSTDDLYELLVDDATSHYERREEELGAEVMRQVERQVMLKIIDTRWREHLFEMDYLQEGINLRAMGQRDPLTEWQREGFDMFGQMMQGIAQDLVRYVMHVQVTVPSPAAAPAVGTDFRAPANGKDVAPVGEQPLVQNLQYSAPEDPSTSGRMAAAARSSAAEAEGPATAVADQPAPMTPVVKSEWDKTPRNAPCPCGSGKKFKLCHGRA